MKALLTANTGTTGAEVSHYDPKNKMNIYTSTSTQVNDETKMKGRNEQEETYV